LRFCAVGLRRIIWSFRKVILWPAEMKMAVVAGKKSTKVGSCWLLGKTTLAASVAGAPSNIEDEDGKQNRDKDRR
jgi:hypothetical protein